MDIRNKKVLLSMFLVIVLAATVVTGCSSNIQTGASEAVATADEKIIDENNMMEIIKELASEKYCGRMAGTRGNVLAAQYIAEYFNKIGLESPQSLENYRQLYKQSVITLKSIPSLSIVDKSGNYVNEFKYVDNFEVRALSSSTNDIDIEGPLYVLNYIDDLNDTNKELKGKVILLSYAFRQRIGTYNAIDIAYRSGAAGIIAEFDARRTYRSSGTQFMTPMIGPWQKKQHNPFINIDSTSFAKLKEASDNKQMIRFKCSFNMDLEKEAPNIIGLLPGSDEKLKNEYIIISCHFDHVGDNLNGTYNPGALDNASGTAAMMEIARVLKQNTLQPKISILFVAFNGEESWMKGSEYYAAHPVYPLEHSVVINLDMVGSTRKIPLTLTTGNSAPKLAEELAACAEHLKIDISKDDAEDSDHVYFNNAGIQAVTLINNDFSNGYHSPGDTPEDVDKYRIEQVVKLVLYYLDKNAY